MKFIEIILKWFPKLGSLGKYLGGWQVYAIIAAMAFAGGAWSAYKVTTWRYDASYAKALESALDDQKKALEASRKIEVRYIEKQGAERVIYRDRIKKVIEYVKVNNDVQCFDDHGLRLYREGLAGQQAPGGTTGSMPRDIAATGER